MGLFSRKHDTPATHESAATHSGRHGVPPTTGTMGTGNTTTAPMGTGMHGGAPMTGAGSGMNGPGMGNTGTGMVGHNEPGYGGNNFEGRHGQFDQGAGGQFNHSSGINDPYGSAGVGHQSALPPTGALNDHNQSRGGTGARMTGKVESAIGSMVGSNALKAKGLQKEQEANNIKLQGQELAEAERLEREALMRRERAVGHGAHPENKHLGAGMNNNNLGRTGPGSYN
ncbi:hypothetical protein BDQ12DRAFT_64726 [Crucibulum laeve]|uniref:CsbD-like domain-containing protein n=1 Tax=Crucibulum laeve TaxID=68775 RepID=A0A5C3LH50_9AGAR|nr:hypothetical protein BDQ12DRAFT_64726 [Crucibulum laeve]